MRTDLKGNDYNRMGAPFQVFCTLLCEEAFPFCFRPSAIQQRAIIPITQGRDVIAQSQSGTGKTATFSISILQSIDVSLCQTQALVLSPTRELAVQIQKVLERLLIIVKLDVF